MMEDVLATTPEKITFKLNFSTPNLCRRVSYRRIVKNFSYKFLFSDLLLNLQIDYFSAFCKNFLLQSIVLKSCLCCLNSTDPLIWKNCWDFSLLNLCLIIFIIKLRFPVLKYKIIQQLVTWMYVKAWSAENYGAVVVF